MSDDAEEQKPKAPVALADRIADGRFELLEEIGDGEGSVVYRANDLAAEEVVAVKVGRLPVDLDVQVKHQYQKMRRLHSSTFAACLGYFVHRTDAARFPVLALELVVGVSLQEYVAHATPARKVEVGRLIAVALDELAAAGLRHGDLLSKNILVRGDTPVLIDPDSDGPGSSLRHHGSSDLTSFIDLMVELQIADERMERTLRDCARQARPFLACAESLRVARASAVVRDRGERLAALGAAHAKETSVGEGRYLALVAGRRDAFSQLVRRVEAVLDEVSVTYAPFDPVAYESTVESERKGTNEGLGDLQHLSLTYRTAQGRRWELTLRSYRSFAKPSPFSEAGQLGLAQSVVRGPDDAADIDDLIVLHAIDSSIHFSVETPYGWSNLPEDWEIRSLEAMLGHRIPAISMHRQLQGPKADPNEPGLSVIHDKLTLSIQRSLLPLGQRPRSQWRAALGTIFDEIFSSTGWGRHFGLIARFDLVRIEDGWYAELDALLADHAVTPVSWRFPLPDLTPRSM